MQFNVIYRSGGILVAALLLWSGLCPAQSMEPVPTGNQVCKTCHVPYADSKVRPHHSDCIECHTLDDESHLRDGGKNVRNPDAEICLGCHRTQGDKPMNWRFSEHGKAQLECTDCHGMHAPRPARRIEAGVWKADDASTLCMDCHPDIAARLNMRSHHPVKEGGLSCVSCHEPHAGQKSQLTNRNDRCFECHQAVRGPKVFEHPPVVEDCGICHDPHGSPNTRLLQVAQPMQCLQCHSLARNLHATGGGGGGRTLTGAQLRNCTNCHGAVHGSHIDPLLKY